MGFLTNLSMQINGASC